MELCDYPLSIRSKSLLMEEDVLKVMLQIAKALQFVHERDVAHLDVKPDNIYVKNGAYKLGDFGCATLLDRNLPIEEGDARYMPREILNEKYDNLDKVDIYSLGVSIYELIKGSSGLHFINLKEGKVPLLPTHSMQLQNLLKTKLLEKVGLLEKEKALWTQEEDSVKQNTAAVSDENTRMRVQVMELGGCRNQLSLDKQQLMENLSSLQSRIEDLERSSASAHSSTDITNDASKDDMDAQIEAASQLVEKLITENADLVEKINELYAELGHWQAKDTDFAISALDSVNGVDFLAANDNRSDDVLVREEGLVSGHSKEDYSGVNGKYPATSGCGEIVQIPLDENETRDLEGQALMAYPSQTRH